MAKLFNAKIDGVPPIDPKVPSGAGLGDKIENTFTRFIQRVMHWGYDFIGELFTNIFDASMKILKPGAMRMFEPFLTSVEKMDGVPDEIKSMIARVKQEQGEAGVLGVLVMVLGIAFTIFGGALAPLSRRLEHTFDVLVRSYIPSPNDLSLFHRLGLLSDQEYQKGLWNSGVPENFKPAIDELSRNVPQIGEIIQGRWRGVISDGDFSTLIKRLGYDDKAVQLFGELSKQIPPISDLIHFQVREAFNDETSNKFQYDADYPGALNPFLTKLGYDADWGKRYWRAHWVLPSPTMAYEMLHRGEIDQTTLKELLKTADYPQFWRDKMMNISYNVLTRIDVRRLLQAGIIDEDKAYKTYQEMGYKPEDARLLTDFAVGGVSNDEKDLSRGDVVNMYEEALLDRGAAVDALVKMGYDSEEGESILKLADVSIARAQRTDSIAFVKEQYLAKKIDKGAASNQLSQIGLKQNGVDRYLLAWDRTLVVDEKLPSLADVKRWYLKDYITVIEARGYLARIGYAQKEVDLYVREVDDQKVVDNEQAI